MSSKRLNNPVVNFTTTSGAGSGLVNLLKKTVEVPFTIVQPPPTAKGPAAVEKHEGEKH